MLDYFLAKSRDLLACCRYCEVAVLPALFIRIKLTRNIMLNSEF